MAEVGIATVSRVLNDSPAVKAATRQRVLEAIEALNYEPHPAAQRLSLGRTNTIALILPFLTRPSTVERLRGVQSALADSDYDLVLFSVDTPEQRDVCFARLTRRTHVDGLLAISLAPSVEQAGQILEAEVPTVLVDGVQPNLNRVIVDDFAGGYQVTQYLLKLGHRKIAFISDHLDNPFNFVSMRLRYEGYCQALSDVGLVQDPAYHQEGVHGRAEAVQMARALLTHPDPPTAIFAASDTQAFGVLDAARELGVPVPEQLSVIGYDDIELAGYMQLTTVHQPLFESGIRGVEMLLAAMGASNGISATGEIYLPLELIVRGTTGPANHRS
jgi:DNA-binding LacI/PurR family transcriptional regulator